MLLSIVIPTFNRNKHVLSIVRTLLPQLAEGTELIVLDNASSVSVGSDFSESLEPDEQKLFKVITNPVNIGADANILRSFELANGEWLWILGDDDQPTITAIQTILRVIQSQKKSTFINFSTSTMLSDNSRLESYETMGQSGFVNGIDYAGNINFMSVGVWKIDKVLGSLNIAYHYTYSMSTTFVLLLSSLGEKAFVIFQRMC